MKIDALIPMLKDQLQIGHELNFGQKMTNDQPTRVKCQSECKLSSEARQLHGTLDQ